MASPSTTLEMSTSDSVTSPEEQGTSATDQTASSTGHHMTSHTPDITQQDIGTDAKSVTK